PSMPTVKEPSGGGNSSQSLGSPSIKLAWSSPNSASSRLATLRVSERTVLTSRLRSIGKKSLRVSRLNPYETREDHLASIYRSSGATGSVSKADNGRNDAVSHCLQSQCSNLGLWNVKVPNKVRNERPPWALSLSGVPQSGHVEWVSRKELICCWRRWRWRVPRRCLDSARLNPRCSMRWLFLSLQRHFSALPKFAHVESRFYGRKRQWKAVFDVPINP